MTTITEKLGHAKLIIRSRSPYLRQYLAIMTPHEIDGLGTVGCTDKGVFFYDPIWLNRWTHEEVAGCVVHEILHLMNRHGTRVGSRDRAEFNMAGDRAINTILRDMGYVLPRGEKYCWPSDLNAKEGLTAEEYYELGRNRKRRPSDPEPHCGSCAGNPTEGEPGPTEAPGATDARLKRAANATSDAINQHRPGAGRGAMPLALKIWAEDVIKPAKVPWQAVLARAIRNAVATRPGGDVRIYDSPTKIQAAIGYGEGCPILPRRRSVTPNVAVLSDTSGSMHGTSDMLMAEVNGILRAVHADVVHMSFDTGVYGITKGSNIHKIKASLQGGGGSDIRPAFKAALDLRPRVHIIVGLTDGDIDLPKAAPYGVRVIWGMVGRTTPMPWGESVTID